MNGSSGRASLDLVQTIIFTLAIYLFTFGSPTAWQEGQSILAKFAWAPETLRDLALLAAFAASAFWTWQSVARSLYGRLAIFFFFYLGGEVPYLYLQANRNLDTGTLWDLAWSLPFAVGTVLATAAIPVKVEDAASESPSKKQPSRRWGFVHVASLIFPLLILLMAAGFAERRLFVAVTLVLLSFACSVARLLISDHQQLQSAKALEESNALLKSVFEGTGDALFIKDLEGRYILVNRTLPGY